MGQWASRAEKKLDAAKRNYEKWGSKSDKAKYQRELDNYNKAVDLENKSEEITKRYFNY